MILLELGDDILDDFVYEENSRKGKREVNPDVPDALWLNVGYWKDAKDYQKAGRDMATLIANVTLTIIMTLIILDVGVQVRRLPA